MNGGQSDQSEQPRDDAASFGPVAPTLLLPKGGGAIRGMSEKFVANPATGAAVLAVPISISPGREGFAPQLTVRYDSGSGNGPFGLGWMLSLPSITRKSHKGLPRYDDANESDVFVLLDAEDLVPVVAGRGERVIDGRRYEVRQYRPRVEGLFARVERWSNLADPRDVFWCVISKDNVATWYGRTEESRVADPADATRIFQWLICQSDDGKGNRIVYRYKSENSREVDTTQTHERNRSDADRSAGRYVKRILYGNTAPLQRGEERGGVEWHFEVVFDYGEHDLDVPTPRETSAWSVRSDPFSTYRAGFEVRTYRLCRRVLTFHHFPDQANVGRDCLVQSTDFAYRDGDSFSFLSSVTPWGYKRDGRGYLRKSVPPLQLDYSEAVIDETIREIDPESLENLPVGLDNRVFRWVDLDGEGAPGILTEQGDAWYYKRNFSPANEDPQVSFGPLETVARKPSLAFLRGGRQQLLDLDGDGQLDLVQFSDQAPGFYERTEDADWDPFTPFKSRPVLDYRDPNLRFIDLTGDGRADLLITADRVFTWYESLGEDGFGGPCFISVPFDEERGPRIVFSDATESIVIADMSGDGMGDVVRIRNGEVCYWPNLGYGRFGAKVSMDNAPWFEVPEQFLPQRVHVADIDGSGASDLVYMGADGVRLYFNRSGNSWSGAVRLRQLPHLDDAVDLSVIDLLGRGTAALVWSSPAPSDAGRPMRYVDLMSAGKPHLLTATRNNVGSERRLEYAPSTASYVADKLAGRPWVTRIPFPVHVLTRVETRDRISGNRFVTRYAYHHGHFDGVEREFAGFGMVDQWDTEEFALLEESQRLDPATNVDASSNVPPVLTRTWFHTGVYRGRDHVSDLFVREYFRGDSERLLPDTVLPAGLTSDEEREACRALRGSMLRQEVYSLDGSSSAAIPYTVTEQNFAVQQLQAKEDNRHAVLFTHARETIRARYERVLHDPRIDHSLTLEADRFGNVLLSAAVAYGRRHADVVLTAGERRVQDITSVTVSENRFTNVVSEPDAYRTPQPVETSTFELTGPRLQSRKDPIGFDEMKALARAAAPISYEEEPAPDRLQKRLIERMRNRYRRDDLDGALPFGQVQSLALPFESYKLAFTPALLTNAYGGRVTDEMLEREGRYVRLDGDDGWWVTAAQVFYSPGADDTAAAELEYARRHFFLPRRYRDPFNADAFVTYDAYDLLVEETRDAVGNRISAGNDYRVLKPAVVTDPNRNVSAVAFDILGFVVGSAVMGKPDRAEGDSLDGFQADLPDDVVAAHLRDPLANPLAILGRATTRVVYDLFAYARTQDDAHPQPSVAYTLGRETHDSDAGGAATRVQHHFVYFDGMGREIQRKAQAAPEEGRPRWVGSGWTVYNNKGKPVRQWEPFFTPSQRFEFDVRVGVSSILFYDPVDRVIARLHPNHTWEKTAYGAWKETRWDANDTVRIDEPSLDAVAGGHFRRLPDGDYLPTWYRQRIDGALGADERAAAEKTAAHADTPLAVHVDPLGRPFLTIAHNRLRDGKSELLRTRTVYDVEGNERATIDALDRVVSRRVFDLLSNRIRELNMEAGERWTLNDVAGKPLYAWNSRGFRLRTAYDVLRRPVETFLSEHGGAEIITTRSFYGEGQPDAESDNARGKVVRVQDQVGVLVSSAYDFKGNLLRSTRMLASEYRRVLDWSEDVELEPDAYESATAYDALNRAVELTAPDGSALRPSYDESGWLRAIEGRLPGRSESTALVTDIEYDARGQRLHVGYGNGVVTAYRYDPLTFRLAGLVSEREGERLQDLQHTYDPNGNITSVRDDSQSPDFFRNQRIGAFSDYTYDAVYRLLEASGRERIGGGNDDSAARYVERYDYDGVGNILDVDHRCSDPHESGWWRSYAYEEPSLIDPAVTSNRLSSTTVGSDVERYSYEGSAGLHGNITSMPHLSSMSWDYRDQLHATAAQRTGDGATPETTWYVYDAGGQRVRKVTDRHAAQGESPSRMRERVYIGGFEIEREFTGSATEPKVERQTLHVMDNQQRVALVESRMDQGSVQSQLIRYQLSDHLRSSRIELDEEARLISREEFYPYGGTSYYSIRHDVETPKRYRYTGSERDEESGFDYNHARYYAPWLGRWVSCDPAGTSVGVDLYVYVRNNPILLSDPSGQDPPPQEPVVLGLGVAERPFPGYPGRLPAVQQYLAEAERNTGLSPIQMSDIPNSTNYANPNSTFSLVRGTGTYVNPAGQTVVVPTGLPSGVVLQEALEGQNGIAAIHINITGVDTVLDPRHTPTELRGIIANANAGQNAAVDLWIMEDSPTLAGRPTVSMIPRGQNYVLGDPLPPRVAQHMNPSFQTPQGPLPNGGNTPPANPGTPPPTPPVTPAVPPGGGGTALSVPMGPSALTVAGNTALTATRTLVPGVAEAEIGFTAGSIYAYGAGYTATGAALGTAAAYTPVVGGALMSGAIVGNLAEGGLQSMGASQETAQTGGALAAAGTGAAVGALIGSAFGGVGAGPGAAIGALAGLGGYYLSKWL